MITLILGEVPTWCSPGPGNGSGYGNGYGSGFGVGDGHGDGYGDGDGHGDGFDRAKLLLACPRLGASSGAGEMNMTSHQNERPVVVTTAHRGVFFGYVIDTSGTTIKLRAARNCLYWGADSKGFLGLAAAGPTNSARVGPAADIELRDITCVAECTEAAVKAWEAAPWSC